MARRLTRAGYRQLLYRAPIPDAVRVLLLWLNDRMRADLLVSVPRSEIIRGLNSSMRTVDRRITEAHELGLLVTVRRGQKGVTAEYRAQFPEQYRHLI